MKILLKAGPVSFVINNSIFSGLERHTVSDRKQFAWNSGKDFTVYSYVLAKRKPFCFGNCEVGGHTFLLLTVCLLSVFTNLDSISRTLPLISVTFPYCRQQSFFQRHFQVFEKMCRFGSQKKVQTAFSYWLRATVCFTLWEFFVRYFIQWGSANQTETERRFWCLLWEQSFVVWNGHTLSSRSSTCTHRQSWLLVLSLPLDLTFWGRGHSTQLWEEFSWQTPKRKFTNRELQFWNLRFS